MSFLNKIRSGIRSDHTLHRVNLECSKAARALPSSSFEYVLEKVPIVQWLPKYNPRWVLNDILAGITVGVLLIPQALAYAKIATIPGEFGLMSSWLPNFLYFIMGTSKDMSTGPTSLMGLLTAEIIRDVASDGASPQAIASAVAMSVGIYSLVVGLFKLGFLLEFVSIPVLNGFVSAAGIVIMLGQIPSLFGVTARSGTANIIHDLVVKVPKYKVPTTAIGLSGILLLVLLQKIGQRWGKQSKVIWLLSLARSAIVLVIFTGISFGVNHRFVLKKEDPIFEISKVKSTHIPTPRMPSTALVQTVFSRAIAPFLAASIEHLAIAKGFGRKNNYTIDQSQELVYLGVTNFFNSFFSSMAVGGAMSRTAVNSDTGVKSPAYGLVAGSFVILAIYQLSGALFWIPKATLAAIIVTAVWHIISPPSVFYQYWNTSLIDFTASMLSFWVTLFVSTEIGIGSAVGFNIAYHILSNAFSHVRRVQDVTDLTQSSATRQVPFSGIPDDTQVFRFTSPVIFANAFRLKSQCLDSVQTCNSGSILALKIQQAERNWSVSGARRLKSFRQKAGIINEPTGIKAVVLDMSMVTCIDTTGLVALSDFKEDLKKFGGEEVELRFVGVREEVRCVFDRFGWGMHDADSDFHAPEGTLERMNEYSKGWSKVYTCVADAVSDRCGRDAGGVVIEDICIVGSEKV
ncbi:sulfate permease [Clohesyomyces aquaticus]|uniref:Sulfate permease n=1 Tax=Clohesyomyces aquaticus TaxID=1231657 RepID=A0A1Y2A8H6_9PLEO|nr:sulfate permease [Clohesyomyces aquaticus]